MTPSELRSEVERLTLDGLSRAEIARRVGCTRQRVSQLCAELGFPHKRPGRPCSSGQGSHRWVGDAISYDGAHKRVRALHGPAHLHRCAHCGRPATSWALNWPECPPERIVYGPVVDGRGNAHRCAYSPAPEWYIPLCLRCHRHLDSRQSIAEAGR